MPLQDKQERSQYSKLYYAKHKASKKAASRAWKLANPAKNKLHRKKYNTIHKQKNQEYRIERKAEWMGVIKARGMDKCFKCGYDSCFEAIDFHHVVPEEKEYSPTKVFGLRVTPKRLSELDKCIALCANCHRETHYEMRLNNEIPL